MRAQWKTSWTKLCFCSPTKKSGRNKLYLTYKSEKCGQKQRNLHEAVAAKMFVGFEVKWMPPSFGFGSFELWNCGILVINYICSDSRNCKWNCEWFIYLKSFVSQYISSRSGCTFERWSPTYLFVIINFPASFEFKWRKMTNIESKKFLMN